LVLFLSLGQRQLRHFFTWIGTFSFQILLKKLREVLSAGELAAYKDFAVYFLSLGLPVILLSLAGITGFHFWNKRKKKNVVSLGIEISDFETPVMSLPLPPLTPGDRQHVIRKIRKQLSGYRARNVALRHDYLYLQKKIKTADTESPDKNTRYMENFEEKITAYEKQIAEMQNKIDMLETIPPPLNNEAHYLRELLSEREKEIQILKNANGDVNSIQEHKADPVNNENLVNEQQQEIHRLKNLIHEQEHINDLLYESREQVNFLQNQLEQRIKTAKLLEQRVAVVSSELNQAQFEFHEAGKKILRTEDVLEEKDKEIGQLRLQVDGKDNELQHLQAEINGKNEQMLALEKSLNEILQENELHKAAIANDREIVSSFNNQLSALNEENEHLKNQLRQNKEVLYRFYKEIRSSVEEENEEHQHLVAAE
jgi:chromosome segregation ATPase